MAGIWIGQSPLKCQLCDLGKIKWKCFDCDKFLCEACLKVHSRIKTQDEHKIVNLKDEGITGIQLKTIKSYETDLLGISAIIPIDDKSIWITGKIDEKRLQRIQLDDKVKVLQDIQGHKIGDGSKLTQEIVLLLMNNSSFVRSLSISGVKQTFCNISPQRVLCTHATNTEVLIGSCEVVKHEERFILTDNCRRQVHIFTLDGQETKVLEKDETGIRLFTYPFMISSNLQSDIIVCDEIGEMRCRIICFEHNGQIKWTYNGNPEISEHFFIMGMAVTPKENVVFTDVYAQTINILNIDGCLIFCKYTIEINIITPIKVAVLSADKLLISNVFLGQKADRDNLYVVNYSGF